jgi:hypothetical protein
MSAAGWRLSSSPPKTSIGDGESTTDRSVLRVPSTMTVSSSVGAVSAVWSGWSAALAVPAQVRKIERVEIPDSRIFLESLVINTPRSAIAARLIIFDGASRNERFFFVLESRLIDDFCRAETVRQTRNICNSDARNSNGRTTFSALAAPLRGACHAFLCRTAMFAGQLSGFRNSAGRV